jgi:hypothetical protein
MAGQPRTFKSGEELIELFEAFCEDIKANDFDELPTQTAFSKYLRDHFRETDKRTIYNSLNEYFPHIKKDFERLQSDVMATGAAKGKYREAITIFALKNWCKWTDKQEILQETITTELTPEERKRRIEELLGK